MIDSYFQNLFLKLITIQYQNKNKKIWFKTLQSCKNVLCINSNNNSCNNNKNNNKSKQSKTKTKKILLIALQSCKESISLSIYYSIQVFYNAVNKNKLSYQDGFCIDRMLYSEVQNQPYLLNSYSKFF